MKKIIILLIFGLTIISVSFQNITSAESDNIYYGKIKSEETYFYTSANENSKLFKLPNSYFVKVEDIEGNFFKAVYKDLNGFVKKNDVTLMRGQPSSPYVNATFTNYVEYALYESPNSTSTPVHEFEKEQIFNFYGTINGEEVSSKTNEWYYASALVNGSTFRGYIYSSITDDLPSIPTNNETFEEISEDVFLQETNASSSFSSLSTGTKILLIVSITIPSIFILFFLIKPSKLIPKKQKAEKSKSSGLRKIHHGDYFEFDDKDL